MAVAFRGVGALSIGAAGVTPVISPSVVADDIMLLLVETANQAVTVANQNGGTWTEIPDSPQGQGTAGAAGGVRLTVFWSRHNGTQGNPTTSDSGEHNAAMVIGYSGCITSGDPFDVTAGDVQAATTAGSIPGDTTTVDGCMIVAMAATDRDSSGSANASGWTNASLVSITERFDETSATGTGGGFAVADGIKTTAGVVDATTWTQAASAALCNIMIALKPPSAAAVVTPAAVTVTSAAPTPTISAASNVLASVLLVVATLGTPAIATAGNVAPAEVVTSVAFPTPSILFGATVTPATVATVAVIDTPSIPIVTLIRDSVSERTNFTSTSPATSSHTPVGTPRSVTVFIAHGTVSTDLITGPVTYGGVAMTRVPTNGFAQDTAGEAGAVYAYHLGAGIPTGTQTLSISHSGAATSKWAIVVYHTAAANTTIVTSGKLEGDQANPQLALDTGATISIRVCVLYSGADAIVGVNALSGMEAIGVASSVDFGTTTAYMGQQSNASTGSFTVGFNVATDDVAFIALAIQEVVGRSPATVAVVATLPTPTVIGGFAATVTPLAVAAVATLPTPILSVPGSAQPATVVATVALSTPAITLSATVFPVTVASVATLPTPSILAAVRQLPAAIARIVTIPTPTVIGGTAAVVTPATIGGDYLDQYGDPYSGGLVVSIPTPTILATSTATPATVTTVATLPTPTVTVAVTVNPVSIAAIVDLPTPTVVGGVSAVVTPTTVSILSTVPDPSIAAGFVVTPATVTTAVILPTATVQAGSTVVSATVTAVAVFPTPTVTAAATVTPTVIPLSVDIPTPGVLVGVGALVLPDTVAVMAVLPTPLISVPISVTPATVLAVVTVPTPTVVGGVSGSVTPTAIAVTIAFPSPSLNAGAEVTPVTVLTSVTLPTPIAGVDATVNPATVTVAVDVPTPSVRAAVRAVPSTVTVTVDVPTPSILGETTAQPATVNAVATLPTPNVVVGAIFPPGFWSPDPVGYVRNPVGFVPIGPDDTPPWN